MHRLLTTIAIRAATCLAVTTGASVPIAAGARADTQPIRPGAVTVLHVPSADSDLSTRDVYVYRPAAPRGAVLPVLYMLHGYPGHPPALARWMAPVLDRLFEHGAAPFVVAIPDGNGRAHPDTEWADSVNGRTLVESSLLRKVLPAVEGPTPLPSGMRAIGGFSMGGYGAANLGLRHPGVFGQIVSISGYYHPDDLSGMFAGRPAVLAANTPDDMVRAAAGRRIQLFESISESDPLIKHQAADFAGRLRACHCVSALDLRMVRGDHNVDFVAASTPAIAAFLDGGWSSAQWRYRAPAGPAAHRTAHSATKPTGANHAKPQRHKGGTRRHSAHRAHSHARRWHRS